MTVGLVGRADDAITKAFDLLLQIRDSMSKNRLKGKEGRGNHGTPSAWKTTSLARRSWLRLVVGNPAPGRLRTSLL
jgi:hypothetical protein